MEHPLDYAFTLEDIMWFWIFHDVTFIINDGHLEDFNIEKNKFKEKEIVLTNGRKS